MFIFYYFLHYIFIIYLGEDFVLHKDFIIRFILIVLAICFFLLVEGIFGGFKNPQYEPLKSIITMIEGNK